jgi:glycosyltransferase involved in cell wall biosynthesis
MFSFVHKMKLLWFSNSGDYSSFSRITDSMLPYLHLHEVTLLSRNKSEHAKHNVLIENNEKYKIFRNGCRKDISEKEAAMKFALILLIEQIYEGDFDWVLICNGIYEVNWYLQLITPSLLCNKFLRRTRLCVWTPIDYVPNFETVKPLLIADKILTTNPIMADFLKSILKNEEKISWLGHGSEIIEKGSEGKENRKKLLKLLNHEKFWTSASKLSVDDIVILNANNCKNTKRKRIDLTLEAFAIVAKKNKNLKLWIHTDLQTFYSTVPLSLIGPIKDRLILSNCSITNKQLSLIYNFCQINVQTSTGEGWSLTNTESMKYGSLQVVPDFLACQFHFKQFELLSLIPVTLKKELNEMGESVIVGTVKPEDVAEKLQIAVELLRNKEQLATIQKEYINYINNYTWKNIAEQLINFF